MSKALIISVVLLGVLAIALSLTGGRHARYRSKARKVHKKFLSGELSGAQALSYLRKIDPYVFEELVLDAFKANGFSVTRNKRYSGDGGVDGRVSYKGKQYLIQCKRYSNYIQQKHVDEFNLLCEGSGKNGYFVHTGRTGQGSWDVKGSRVRFISGERLLALLRSKDDPDVTWKKQ